MMLINKDCLAALALCLAAISGFAEPAPLPRALWLTYARNLPTSVMVNWSSDKPEPSIVHFGPTPECKGKAVVAGSNMLHHVEVSLPKQNEPFYYRLESNVGITPAVRFRGIPDDELRIAMVADWADKSVDVTSIIKDKPHLVVSGGDNISRLHGSGLKGDVCRLNLLPHLKLLEAYPELFRTTPFMPVLGNHDREIRPRAPLQNLTAPVYDIGASAYRELFSLPNDGWKWFFEMPEFGLRLIGLDLSHVQDTGTFLQSCNDYRADSCQLRWFRQMMLEAPPAQFIVILSNEKSSTVRGLVQGEWGRLIRRGTLAATGFGYFAERAEEQGFPWYNTSLNGKGNVYKDAFSQFLARENNYLLFTLKRGAPQMKVEIKRLNDGTSLDTKFWPRYE